MRRTLIDINPWGVVEDLHTEPDLGGNHFPIAGYFAKLYNEGDRDVKLLREKDDTIELDYLNETIRLRVKRVLGGNQWNVYKNLKTMKAEGVSAHFGIPDEKIARKVLYVPGIPGKIDIKNPDGIGKLVWNQDLKDTDVFISSSPPIIGGEDYWKGLREALARDKSTGIIWNPQRKQIAKGGLAPETLKSLKGRVKILQVNEAEGREMVQNYLHRDGNIDRLKDLVRSDWTIVTKGAQGIRGYVNGRICEVPASQKDINVKAILGEDYCEGMDVGCGDMVMATLITRQDNILEDALKFASFMGKIQYHHQGSNISSVKSFTTPAEL